MQDDPDFVTALARGLSILSCFQVHDTELGNGEIGRRTGLAPATVARLTYTLTRLGYLRSIAQRRKYALSARVLSIGYPILASLPERELARAHVQQLAMRTGGSACLAIADGLRAVYIEASRASSLGQYPDIGTHRPVLDSSVGRALFAGMADPERKAVLNQLCVLEPDRAAELQQSARKALLDHQQYGLCVTESLVIPGWSAVAIPLQGLHKRGLALSLGVPSASVPAGRLLDTIGEALKQTAARIEEAFRPGAA